MKYKLKSLATPKPKQKKLGSKEAYALAVKLMAEVCDDGEIF